MIKPKNKDRWVKSGTGSYRLHYILANSDIALCGRSLKTSSPFTKGYPKCEFCIRQEIMLKKIGRKLFIKVFNEERAPKPRSIFAS